MVLNSVMFVGIWIYGKINEYLVIWCGIEVWCRVKFLKVGLFC